MTTTPNAKRLKTKIRSLLRNKKIQEICYWMGTEILHFGKLETEKKEFKVNRSNLQRLKNLDKQYIKISSILQNFKINFLTF